MEIPTRMDDLGVSPFMENYGNLHMLYSLVELNVLLHMVIRVYHSLISLPATHGPFEAPSLS